MPRWARIAFVAIVLTCAVAGVRREISSLVDHSRKTMPTDFSGFHNNTADVWAPERPVRKLNGSFIDDRYVHTRYLGHGQEGSAALYLDRMTAQSVVVKTYTSPGRNPLPSQIAANFAGLASFWPTEIEAGLLLAETKTNASYVPIIDYFLLQDGETWSWALVSAFVPGGTLVRLEARERPDHKTPEQLDWLYRSSLTALMASLKPLHDAGVCHDDVKGDNIYVHSPQEWLLGDLGNVRHVSHPWHFTSSWKGQNQWADCQLNDVRRVLKSYMWFLRQSCQDTAEFDREFWIARAAWSRLYWSFVQHPKGVEEMLASLEKQRAKLPEQEPPKGNDDDVASPWKWRARLAVVTERELICTSIPRRLWKWWWWITGP